VNIIKRWWTYKALGKYKPQHLSTHSKAPNIKSHLRHLEHYLPHRDDRTLSKGRREQIEEEILIHSAKLKRCGIEPPTDGIQAAEMLNEFSWQHYT
jgi:hypothetical protein